MTTSPAAPPGATPLASLDDLRTYLQTDNIDADQAATYLALASAMVRGYLRAELDYRADDVVSVIPDEYGFGYGVILPGAPVISVATVEAWGYDGAWYDITPNVTTVIESGLIVLNSWPVNGLQRTGRFTPWRVTYTHGYSTVPDEIRYAVTMLAGGAFAAPAGVDAETVGGYSVKYGGGMSVAGLPAEVRAMLDIYRSPVIA